MAGPFFHGVIAMRPFLFLLALILTAPFALQAPLARAAGLYEADVPVASQDNSERDAGIRRALQAVLVKVSGSRHVLQNPQIAEAVSGAPGRVLQFYFRSISLPPDEAGVVATELRLFASFQPATIDELLRRAGEPRLSANRPASLMWLAIDEGAGPRLASREGDPVSIAWLEHHAAARAVPLRFPSLDLEELGVVSAETVAALDDAALVAPSARYGAGTVVIARLVRGGTGEWIGEWKLRTGEDVTSGQGQAPARSAVTEQLVADVAESLSTHFAVRAGLENAEELRLRVDGITSLQDYRALAAQLGRLGSVRQALPGLIERDTVYVDLLTDSGIDSVMQELSLVPQLRPEGEPAERRFRWSAQ